MDYSYNVVNFVRSVAERLMLSANFKREQLVSLIEAVRDDLTTLQQQYSAPAPEGIEVCRDLLLEALEFYHHSLGEILEFLEDHEIVHLLNAVLLAEEGADVVLAVEDVVSTNKRLLADQVAA